MLERPLLKECAHFPGQLQDGKCISNNSLMN
jgi:hypothetical protein